MMRSLILLGATGSIGRQVLEILDAHPEAFRVVALTAHEKVDELSLLIDKYRPEFAAIGSEEQAAVLKNRHPEIAVGYGETGLIEAATWRREDRSTLLVNALVGSCGLAPTYHAVDLGRPVALANKETLVIGGDLIMDLARERHVQILPIDSEHSAIWQCLQGNDKAAVRRMIITASGGAFRDKSRDELATVDADQALQHPNWSMGAKITIDSATMMNKGFEVIEAHHLFGIPADKIDTVLHPESYVHSLVEYTDGSILAQISDHDMRLPIAYALFGGSRHPNPTRFLSLESVGKLTFSRLDPDRYPMLGMAYEALNRGGIHPCVLNAANEAAVRLFLRRSIPFLEIENIVRRDLDHAPSCLHPTLDDLLKVDREVQTAVLRQYLK